VQLQSWQELCREHAKARLEGDAACKAIAAKLTTYLAPTPEELKGWDRACEQIVEVDERMHRFINTSLPTG
jgi:hypothetical protein